MSDFVTHNGFPVGFFTDDGWAILTPIEQSIKSKIDTLGVPLKEWNISINFGIKTGFNEAFIIDGYTKAQLIEKEPNSAEIIRPILRGRDVKRFSFDSPDLWLLYIPWHFPLQDNENITGVSAEAEEAFKTNYPAVYDYLEKHKEALSKRNKAETGIRYEWYALQRWGAKYKDEFSKQKIVWKRIGSLLRFAYDDSGCVTLDSTCIATGKNIKYIAAILNTTLGNYMFKDSPKTGTGDLIVSVQAFEPIKIPQIEECEIQKFEELYDSISNCIKNGADYSAYENKLEELTFNLYGISDTEKEYIKEVSNKFFR